MYGNLHGYNMDNAMLNDRQVCVCDLADDLGPYLLLSPCPPSTRPYAVQGFLWAPILA